jgi:hypothetical protein
LLYQSFTHCFTHSFPHKLLVTRECAVMDSSDEEDAKISRAEYFRRRRKEQKKTQEDVSIVSMRCHSFTHSHTYSAAIFSVGQEFERRAVLSVSRTDGGDWCTAIAGQWVDYL